MNLSNIIDELRAELLPTMHNGQPKGRCCKYCKTALAVVAEEPTIVHVRNEVQNTVSVKCLYHGKRFCMMCHRYQA